MIRRTAMVILYRPHQQTNTCSKPETITLEITEDNSNKGIFKKQTAGVFYKKKSSSIFRNTLTLTKVLFCSVNFAQFLRTPFSQNTSG